jgi:Na+-transporting methylmalonyl-CoA/oxaloacetate decarboxylase gamma subunit
MDIVIFFVSILILVLWFGGMNDLIKRRAEIMRSRREWEEENKNNPK